MKKKFIALAMVVIMVLGTVAGTLIGCDIITTNAEKDYKQVVATVQYGGLSDVVLKGELRTIYNSYGPMYVQYYGMTEEEALEYLFDSLARQSLLLLKAKAELAKEMGITFGNDSDITKLLTDDEIRYCIQRANAEFKSQWEANIEERENEQAANDNADEETPSEEEETDEELEALTRGEGGMDSPQGTPGNAGIFGGTLPSLRGKGVLPIVTTDGPAGIRIKSYTTLLPCGTALGATWDEELIEKLYEKIGEEMVLNGSDLLLGPGMNIHRNPLCGRNFEYFSEDPLLTGRAAAAFVRGVQRSGRGACPKHFACNNQERNRTRVDSRVSERALREIYLRCFEICVAESDPAAVMTSYNKINGVWNHYNYDLATTVLRGDWGYRGCVVTDWWMRRSASPEFPKIEDNAYRVRAQVDVLMPGNMSRIKKEYESDGTLLATLGQEGGITRAEIERSAKNVLRSVLRLKYGKDIS